MLEQFITRNLNETMKFLCKIGVYNENVVITTHNKPKDQIAMNYQNLSLYSQAYSSLLCDTSMRHRNNLVFCYCCSSVTNFIRNYNLLSHLQQTNCKVNCEETANDLFTAEHNVIKYNGFVSDPFTDFIVALANKNIPFLVDLLSLVPLFWEGFLALTQMTEEFIQVSGPLASYFYMLLKVEKDIDPPEFKPNYLLQSSPTLDDLPYKIEIRDQNLLAAFLFACGDTEKSLTLFNRIFFDNKGASDLDVSNFSKNSTILSHLLSDPDDNSKINNQNGMYGCENDYLPVCEKKDMVDNIKNSHRRHLVSNCENDSSVVWLNNNEISLEPHAHPHKPTEVCDVSSCDPKHFPKINSKISFDYSDIFAYLLYSNNKSQLSYLAQLLRNEYPNTPEAYAARAINYSASDDFLQAIIYFKKSLKLKHNPDILCMLGHAYAQIRKVYEAENCFFKALNGNRGNYRIIYAAAHGFFLLEKLPNALRFAKLALRLRGDGAIWKLTGRIYMRNGEYAQALHAFETAEKLNAHDSLLYMAEIYKKTHQPETAINLYERYVEIGEHNRKAVAKYLSEYFQEAGDMEKSMRYKNIL